MRRALFGITAGTLLIPCLALAQEQVPPPSAPTPRELVGQVLEQARASGALERILGERHFFFHADAETGAVMTLNAALLETGGLRLEMSLFGLTGRLEARQLELVYDLDFSGHVQRLEVIQLREEKGGHAQAFVKDGMAELQMRITGQPGIEARSFRWDDQALPFTVTVFLASLHDQGLPRTLRFHMFEGEDLRLNDQDALLEVSPGPKPELLKVSCRKRADDESSMRYDLTVRGEGEGAGELLEMAVGEARMTPIPEKEARRLRATFRAPDLAPRTGPSPEAPRPETPPEPGQDQEPDKEPEKE